MTNIDTKSKNLILVMIILVATSAIVTYYKYMILGDYVVTTDSSVQK